MKVNLGYHLLMAELITKVYIASRTRRNEPPQLHSAVNHFTDNFCPLLLKTKTAFFIISQ